MSRRRILFAGVLARMKETKLAKCVMFGEMVRSADCVEGQEKEWMECFLAYLRAFGINADQWTTAAQDEGNGTRPRNKGRHVSRQNMLLQRNSGLDYGMQWYYQP